MDQAIAVLKRIKSIQQDGGIPIQYLNKLYKELMIMYALGYDERRNDEFIQQSKNRHKTPIKQLDKYHKVIQCYESVEQALQSVCCARDTIYTALKSQKLTKYGYWEYVI